MKRTIILILIAWGLSGLLWGESIDRIEIIGNKKVSRDTILFYLKSREKGPFSEEILRQDMKTLWETGFFENIRIETRDTPDGKIVRLTVWENPLISSVTYKINKKVKENDITQKLQEKNISLATLSYFNPSKIKKAEQVIREFLQEKGFNQGTINFEQKMVDNQVALTVNIDPGPKTRIGKVVFPGLDPKKISPVFLRAGMKENQQHSLLAAIMSKDVYNREKIDEDLEEVRLRLQQKGFMEAKVGNPEFSTIEKTSIFGKTRKMTQISIPVELGPQYKLAKINIEGTKIIRAGYLKNYFKMKIGKIYNAKKKKKAIEEIQKFYGSLGYLYCNINASENLDPVERLIDLNVNISEGDVVYLGKLEFKGNTFTKDHVLRREWLLREGFRMSMTALENSIRRMKQLGLVTIDKMPDIQPDPQDPQKVNITADVKEMNRQMINFNVGYSGWQGWFISLGYSTQNFLGMGEQLNINFLHGTRSKDYQFSFTEPYLFNLPANFGFDVFKTHTRLPGFPERLDEGFSLSSSWRFWKYWGASIVYGFQNIDVRYNTEADTEGGIDSSYFYNSVNPYMSIYYQPGKRSMSYISPTISYTTVDSPIFPTSGWKFLLNYRFSGGFLGGNIFLHKYRVEFVKFQPLWRRHVLGFHAQFEHLHPFGGRTDYPYYERFYLGGERSIRGFEYWQVGPRNEEGTPIGGDKSLFMNFEYAITLTEQFSLVFFYDVGNSYDTGQKIDLRDVYSSMGIEVKVFLPILGVPIRLILAHNPRRIYPEDQPIAFRFAIGPSFN